MRRIVYAFALLFLFGCAHFRVASLYEGTESKALFYIRVFINNQWQESVVIGFKLREGEALPDFLAEKKENPHGLILHFPRVRFSSVASGFVPLQDSALVESITVDADSRQITITAKENVQFVIYQGSDFVIVRVNAPKEVRL